MWRYVLSKTFQRWRYVLSKTFQCEDMSCLKHSKDISSHCNVLDRTYLHLWFLLIRKVWRHQRVIWSRKSKKYRKYNDQKKIEKGTNNDIQNTIEKTKDWTPRNRWWIFLLWKGKMYDSRSTIGTRCLTPVC
jgi:hypothetical protein